ncbi:MAG: sensor histidine kinase [Hormoscilla sp.]
MKNGADRIEKIVLSLRNFSRLDESEMKAADINEGIDNTLLILNHGLHQRIVVNKDYVNLPLVYCYPAQLNQVFLNIIENAIDALLESSGTKNPQIYIRTEKRGDRMVMVTIRDNGPGIPESIIDKLFDPFFPTKEVGKGTGMGLAIAYQIIEKHQGKFEVSSEAGKGASFAISIPIHPEGRSAIAGGRPQQQGSKIVRTPVM